MLDAVGPRRAQAVICALFATLGVGGCQLAPTYQSAPDGGIPRRRFGEIGEAGMPSSAHFGPRLGPATNPWSDAWADGPAPPALGAMRGTIPSASGYPDLVADGRAYYDDGSALVALDLETGTELWRSTRMTPEVVATDGTRICGVADTSASWEAIVVCLSIDDGHELFRDGTGGFLTTGGETTRLGEVVLAGELLFVRAYTTLFAYDLTTGTRIWTREVWNHWRAIAIVDGDLVVTATCAGQACLAALDPSTGAEVATHVNGTAMAYLFVRDGEAIFAPYSFGTGGPVAYSSATDTFREAPEWSWVGNVGGVTEILADGTAFVAGIGGGLNELDVEGQTVRASYPAEPGTIRIYTNAVVSVAFGSLMARPRGAGTSTPAPALHYERWSFAGGAWYDVP